MKGDYMKKWIPLISVIVIVIVGLIIFFITKNTNEENTTKKTENTSKEELTNDNVFKEEEIENMQILVSDGTNDVIYELISSQAALDLYNQLPLTLEVETFSTNEKIFYPPAELNTASTPNADEGGRGVLAYYAPWGDVVMFYDSFSSASGLYMLGNAIEGKNKIENLSGEIKIEKITNK